MEALRLIQEVSKDGYLHIRVPQKMGWKFELIILPLDEAEENESSQHMKIQEESGFVKTVLASAAEDVWNDL